MVLGGGDGAHPVRASFFETTGNVSSELAVDSSIVEALEKGENTWVGGLRRVERCELFNDNVAVPLDLPLLVQLLGCSIVGGCSVGKKAGLHPLYILESV